MEERVVSWGKIGQDSFYVMAATVSTQLLQWLILTSIARVEGARMLGLYALAQAFALPLQYLAWLSIRQRYLTLKDPGEALPTFIFLRLALPIVIFVSTFVTIKLTYFNNSFVWLCGLVFLAKYVEGIYDLIYAVEQQDGKTQLVARLSFVRTLLSGSAFAFLYFSKRNIFVSLFATTALQVILLFLIKRPNDAFAALLRSAFTLDWKSMKARLLVALELLPVSVSMMVMSLNTSVPRLLLDHMSGVKELGYFVAISSFISLGAVAVGSLGQSLLQPLSKSIQELQRKAFWLQLIWPMLMIVAICTVSAFVSIPLGPHVLRLVYGPDFVSISPLLFYGSLASGPMFAASIASLGVFVAYLRGAFFWSQLAAAFVSAIGVIALVPDFRLEGVFLALGLSGLLQIVMSTVVLHRYWSSLCAGSMMHRH